MSIQAYENIENSWESIKNLHKRITKKYKIVGSSISIIKNGNLIHEQHIGYADRASKRKADGNTIYNWASITKTLTGIAIMQLRDSKKLKLTDPIIKYIPELKKMKNPFGKMEDITLWHILTHSAGFRCDTWITPSPKRETWKNLMVTISGFEILFKPGTKYSYSNLAFNFLGQTIERITGMPYSQYIKKNIFNPIGMTNSYFNITPKRLLKNRSNNYFIQHEKTIPNGLDFETGVTASNCGLNASCSDMIKYIEFLCNGGFILKRSSLEEMWNAHFLTEKDKDFMTQIGFSFFLLHRKRNLFIGHTGSSLGYLCFMYVNQKNKTGCLVNLNTSYLKSKTSTRKGLYELRKEILDTFLRGSVLTNLPKRES